MSTKIIHLDSHFETGEPTIQPVLLWGLRSKPFYESLSKEASYSPALDYIKSIEPVPGKTIVLILGLGSYEFYGLNRNGDGFNERPYKPGSNNGKGRNAWVQENECIQHHYQSYENGHVFKHHVNKDPRKAVGRVIKAFWNPYMHRVEILEDLDNKLAPDVAGRIADGEYPAKSMGCRIKFDVCTVCGNKAPTRRQYCDHLKFEMGRLRPDGVRVGALNPAPNFFDSSWVLRPADRTGFMLKKVANVHGHVETDTNRPYELWSSCKLGEYVDDLQDKAAAAQKLALIDKVVRGYPAKHVVTELPEAPLIEKYRDTTLPSVVRATPQLSSSDLKTLTPHNLSDVLSELSRAGIILTTPEFVTLFMQKATGKTVSKDVLRNIVATQGELFSTMGEHPTLLSDTLKLFPEATGDKEVRKKVEPLIEKRSTVSDYLNRRFTPRAFRHAERPTSDILTVDDPNTRRSYATTVGAANLANDTIAKRQLLKVLGGSALLAAAYKASTYVPGLRRLKLPVAAGLGYLGYKGLKPTMGPSYTARSGEKIPYLTEFVEKHSSLLDTVNVLGQDYELNSEGPSVFTERLTKSAQYTGTSALRNVLTKLSTFGETCSNLGGLLNSCTLTSNGISEEQLDFDKTAELIGLLVL